MSTTITLKGNEVHTIGALPSVGTTVKDFALVDSGLNVKTLQNFDGKKKVFNIFPSIDTPTCAASSRKFNEEASKLDNTVIINVSKDLPFALGRFCAAEGLNNVDSTRRYKLLGTIKPAIGSTFNFGDSALLDYDALDAGNFLVKTRGIRDLIIKEKRFIIALLRMKFCHFFSKSLMK
ncbi:thiol peroxidase [Chryseobacterium cucumeris]|uniref:thiol peroxidase n=1 Tax=Chryseobacterium cucumeris TaxID=1813611 RepID=UPI0023F1368C|nr:thiol peroxidase [Chryseobacterium cucumeris]